MDAASVEQVAAGAVARPLIDPAAAAARSAMPVVFLDKDGTLIDDLPYNVDPRRIRLARGAREAVRRLAAAGFRIVIVTNQSGVARGYYDIDDLEAVARHLAAELGAMGAVLDGFYACPHLPDGLNDYAVECDCRKPGCALVQRAVADLRLRPDGAWFVGDTWMDMVAGRSSGCRTILVGPDARQVPRWAPERRPDHIAETLLDAAETILAARAGEDTG